MLALMAVLFCAVLIQADTVGLRSFYIYNFHLELFKIDEFNDIYLQDKPIPGIGQYYHSSGGISIEASYLHASKKNWLLTFGYSSHNLDYELKEVNAIFGEELSITKLYILFGSVTDFKEIKGNYHLSFGPVLNYYEGLTDYDHIRYEIDYKPSITYRINLGAEYHLSYNIYGNFGIAYEFGPITRGNMKIYHEDEWIATFEPTSKQTIKDNQIIMSLGFSYKYSLGSTE